MNKIVIISIILAFICFVYAKISSNSSVPLCCEVNTVPLNQQSLDFHRKQKFEIIEELKFGKKRVAMQVKY